MTYILPVVLFNRQRYIVDVRLGELRREGNPNISIPLHNIIEGRDGSRQEKIDLVKVLIAETIRLEGQPNP